MRRVRLTLLGVLIVVLIVTAFGLLYAPALSNREEARQSWEQARQELEELSTRRLLLEDNVSALRTRVDSVELSARVQYRLIRPGERVEILEESDVLAEFLARMNEEE